MGDVITIQDIKDVYVNGTLSQLFKGFETTELAKSMVGRPIKDDAGNVIGVIDRVDVSNDMWFGHIFNAESIPRSKYMSMEIKKPSGFCKACRHHRVSLAEDRSRDNKLTEIHWCVKSRRIVEDNEYCPSWKEL